MHRMLKLSWLNVKNTVFSKEMLIGVIAAFSYSMLWVFFVHPKHYGLQEYDFEIGRFLYIMLLYLSVSLLRNDIRFNTTKAVFSGVFSRTKIMISKAIGLVMVGIILSMIIEVNNVLISLILFNKIGLLGFLSFNHLQLFIDYIAITLAMGSLMILIISLMFNGNKSILFYIAILSMVNFYTAGIPILVKNHPELLHNFIAYMKTPFYNTIILMNGSLNMQPILINLAWAIMFCLSAVFIINKREIR